MNFLILAIAIFTCSIDLAFVETAIDLAARSSGVNKSDTDVSKAVLLLHLLNDSPYLSESSPDPKFKGYARFSATSFSEASRLMRRYSMKSSGAPFAPYDLDSNRTPKEMLEQRIGGSCGTHARVFAELALNLGVPKNDIKIVSAVSNDEYALMCPNGMGSKIDKLYRGGASGHVFVLMKVSGEWKLVNTTYSPYDIKTGPRAAEIQELKRRHRTAASSEDLSKVKADSLQFMRGLNISEIEAASFDEPTKLQKGLVAGLPISVPEFQSLPESIPGRFGPIQFRKMTVFDISEPDKYLNHSWNDRYNLIASGKRESDTCRFTLPNSRPRDGTNSKAAGTQK
jgi:hypothetical protein